MTAFCRQVTRQHHLLIIYQRDRVLGRDFCRNAKAQQPVYGVFAQHNAGKLALVVQRHLQLQTGSVVAARVLRHQRPGIHRLTQIARQLERAIGIAQDVRLAGRAQLIDVGAGRYIRRQDVSLVVHPGHSQQFGVLVDQRFGLQNKFVRIDFLVRNVPRNAHQLLLPLQQPQAQPLLGIFNVAREGLLLTVYFFKAQIAKSRHHGSQEKHDGQQGAERDEAVLPRRRLPAPPTSPPCQRQRYRRSVGVGKRGRLGHREKLWILKDVHCPAIRSRLCKVNESQ